LEMGALRALGTIGEAAVRATAAGHDMLLMCSDLGAAKEARSALQQAYESGRLSRVELSASVARIEHLRQKNLLPNP